MMPVMMIFIFWTMSSGLVLYWTLFNVLTIGQQLLVNHLKKDATGGPV
jgi:membrane protein insertase Oxa1/YidC/SpoIIIJ